MKIVVVGTGYVGLVSGACLAEIGHQVTCIDIDQAKIDRLKQGQIPIFEPGLEEVVVRNAEAGRLTFSTELPAALPGAQAVFIAVGTPSQADGQADLQYVYAVADTLGQHLQEYVVVVNKSTVPVGTGATVRDMIAQHYTGEFDIASCPEFLREGSAVQDFMNPDRVVIGVRNEKAQSVMLEIFAPLSGEKVVTTVESAELIKYASNAFLATKISFINEIAQICERTGADIEEVAHGVGLDPRIGGQFLKSGIGWGGSCFPKDVQALDYMAGKYGYDFKLLKAVIEVNNFQRQHFVAKIKQHFGGSVEGKRIGVLGLAFKGNTDDVRDSAAIDIIKLLVVAGAEVAAFDYEGTANAQVSLNGVTVNYVDAPEAVADQADAVVLATEWPQFISLDWKNLATTMKTPVVFDGRNVLDPAQLRADGFTYYCVGRADQ